MDPKELKQIKVVIEKINPPSEINDAPIYTEMLDQSKYTFFLFRCIVFSIFF